MPIGIQNFEKLREENYLYIDKTSFIYSLACSGGYYFLSRPRRFGKSLFLSTLEAYFLGKKAAFKGLALESLEEGDAESNGREPWQIYPVFHFDFNSANYSESNGLSTVLSRHLCKWEGLWGANSADDTPSSRFISLLREAHKKTGRQCVVLVDEYDKPLLGTIDNPELQEKNRQVLKAFFGVLKSEDAHIRFAFLTGVTKFSQVSVFSDLNNLNDISMDYAYNEICGISQTELEENFMPEIQELAEKNDMTKVQCLKKLKENYDGYHFCADSSGIYNPFSLLNTFSKKAFNYYWFQTGTPTFLVKAIEKSAFDFRQMLTGVVAEAWEFSEYRFDYNSPIPLLYQSGYLTVKDFDKETMIYTLEFPNEEVKYGFMNFLLETTMAEQPGVFSIARFYMDMKNGAVENMMTRLQSLFASIPYNVYGNKSNITEQTFQQTIFLVFNLMGQFTQSEIHSAKGRADCVVATKDRIFVFEFKLEGSAQDALEQIESREYAVPYNADGRKVIKIGVAFEKDNALIKDWAVKE